MWITTTALRRLLGVLAVLILLVGACNGDTDDAADGVPPEDEDPDAEVEADAEGAEVDDEEAAEGVETVTLTAASAFGEDDAFTEGFWIFDEVVSELGEGQIELEFTGGPEAIPPFELFDAVRDGVVDIGNLPANYSSAQIPITNGMKLSPMTPWEEREASVFEFWQEVHSEQQVQYLGKVGNAIPFALYVNEPVDQPDLSGLTIRLSPIYEAFVDALGGSGVSMDAGETYTALERGAVDGYGWPMVGLPEAGLQEVTDYRINHGFYQMDLVLIMNEATWNELPDTVQSLLTEIMEETERRQIEHYNQRTEDETAELPAAGVEMIEFDPELADEYLELADDAAWEELLETAPEDAERLQELYGVGGSE